MRGASHLLLFCLLLGLGAHANEDAATNVHTLTNRDLSALSQAGKLERWRVELRDPTNDVARIESTGVVIRTLEKDYAVVAGDRPRIDRLRALGFTTISPREADYKKRKIRVWVTSKESYLKLLDNVSDLFPERASEQHWPAYI